MLIVKSLVYFTPFKYIIKVIIDNKIFKKLKMMSFTVIFFVATFLKDVGMLELEVNKG